MASRSSTIAVRPPGYFPGLAYAALLHRVDCFVLADTFEFSRRSTHNRARLRTPQGAQWITVPVEGGQTHRRLADVVIDNGAANGAHWRSKHWRALQYDYRSSPYFDLFEPKFAPFFDRTWEHLGPCACASVELMADLANISTDVQRASRLPGAPETLPGVLQSLDAKAADVLVPPEAADYDASLLEGTGHRVHVLSFEAPSYQQVFEGFVSGLSFLDLAFGYGPEACDLLARNVAVRPFDRAEAG